MNTERYVVRFTMRAENEEAEVMIYSEIAGEKWWGDETTTGDFDKALKEARKNGASKLNVRINSPGGEVYAAVAMRSMIINAGFDSVRVMIEGLCASAATLFATIPEAHVVIAEGSEFMIHNPMTITWGNAGEIMKTVEHLYKLEEQFHDMYSFKTGKTKDEIKSWMDAETWFTAKEACEHGFCDELLASEKAVACVTMRDMEVMRALYKSVPEHIAVANQAAAQDISNGEPGPAGEPTEIHNHEEVRSNMEIENIGLEQLREGNPALVDQIAQNAISAERQRIQDIDALTLPGYEGMAEEAKANGTSAMEFQRKVVQAQRQKATDFIANRQKETAPAANVPGSAPQSGVSEEQQIEANAKDVAAYAKEYLGNGEAKMF